MKQLRILSRRTLTAALAVLLLGTAAVPVTAKETHAMSVRQYITYFDSFRGTVVGEALVYCDGTYQLLWGVATNFALYATNDCTIVEA
jgi:hypothetical protein